jgi:hypothetical protein
LIGNNVSCWQHLINMHFFISKLGTSLGRSALAEYYDFLNLKNPLNMGAT